MSDTPAKPKKSYTDPFQRAKRALTLAGMSPVVLQAVAGDTATKLAELVGEDGFATSTGEGGIRERVRVVLADYYESKKATNADLEGASPSTPSGDESSSGGDTTLPLTDPTAASDTTLPATPTEEGSQDVKL
jgi:hypothetical protein